MTEERAESQVFAHDPDGKLAHIPAGKPRRLRPEEVMALVGTVMHACIHAQRLYLTGSKSTAPTFICSSSS